MSECKPSTPSERVRFCLAMPGLTPRETTVLVALASHDGETGAWPSVESIADLLGIKRSTAFEVIAALERKGALSRRNLRHTNLYTIAYHESRLSLSGNS